MLCDSIIHNTIHFGGNFLAGPEQVNPGLSHSVQNGERQRREGKKADPRMMRMIGGDSPSSSHLLLGPTVAL